MGKEEKDLECININTCRLDVFTQEEMELHIRGIKRERERKRKNKIEERKERKEVKERNERRKKEEDQREIEMKNKEKIKTEGKKGSLLMSISFRREKIVRKK